MVKRLSWNRDVLSYALIVMSVMVTVLLSMNLLESLDRYTQLPVLETTGDDYTYTETVLLLYDGAGRSDEECLKKLSEMFTLVSGVSCNAWLSEMYGIIGEAETPKISVYLNYAERPPMSLEEGFFGEELERGAYVGNAYAEYIVEEAGENQLHLFSDMFPVLGVLAPVGFSENETVIVGYEYLREASRQEVAYLLYEPANKQVAMTVALGSMNHSVEEDVKHLRQGMTLLGGEATLVESENTTLTEGETASDVYGALKFLLVALSLAFCVVNLVQVVVLFMGRRREQLAVCRALGMKRRSAYFLVWREMMGVSVGGLLLATLIEAIVYVGILEYPVGRVFVYGTYGYIGVFICLTIISFGLFLWEYGSKLSERLRWLNEG